MKIKIILYSLLFLFSCTKKLEVCYVGLDSNKGKELLLEPENGKFEYYINTSMLTDTIRGNFKVKRNKLELVPYNNSIELKNKSDEFITIHVMDLINQSPISGALVRINGVEHVTDSRGYINTVLNARINHTIEIYFTGYSFFKKELSGGEWVVRMAQEFRYNEDLLQWKIKKGKLRSSKYFTLKSCID